MIPPPHPYHGDPLCVRCDLPASDRIHDVMGVVRMSGAWRDAPPDASSELRAENEALRHERNVARERLVGLLEAVRALRSADDEHAATGVVYYFQTMQTLFRLADAIAEQCVAEETRR